MFTSLRNALKAFVFLCVVAPVTAHAVTTEYRVLIDADNNASTGCTVSTPTGPFTGVEVVVITTTDTNGTTGTVTGVTRQVCTAGTLGAPSGVDAGGWAVGNVASGNHIIETKIPLSLSGLTLPSQARLGFVGNLGGGVATDTIVNLPSGGSILFPTDAMRRRAATPSYEVHAITLDGSEDDWGTLPALVFGGGSGSGLLHFGHIRAWVNATDLYFELTLVGSDEVPIPIAVPDSYTVRQGHSLTVPPKGVLANDIDLLFLLPPPLTATLVTGPTHASNFSLASDGSFVYTNNGSSATQDVFKYKASKGPIFSDDADVTIHVTPDAAPVAVADGPFSVPYAGTLTVPPRGVLTNDTDSDDNPNLLTAVLVAGPAHASSFTLNSNGSFTYTHNGTNFTTDFFTYRASDGVRFSNTIQVNINIGADSPPVANPDTYGVNEGGTLTVPAPGVMSNDTDPDVSPLPRTASVVTGPLHASSFTLNPDGSFTYVHDGSETTIDTFTYKVNDGILDSNVATVTINITPVNDAPVAVADAYSTNEDTPLVVPAGTGVLANDTDADTPHSSLTAVLNSGPASAQSFTLNPDGSFNYTPNADFNGSDSFTYHAFDGAASSNSVTVSITINAVNDAPVITRPANVSTNEDTPLAFTGGNTVSIADVDAGAGTLSLTLGVTQGTLTIGAPGPLVITGNGTASLSTSGTLAQLNSALASLTYAPAANYNGADTLSIGVNDGGNTGAGGPQTANATTAISVVAVDDPPVNTVPGAQSINEDATLTFTGATAISVADIDAGAGNLQVTLSTANGTITLGGTVGLTVTGNGTSSVQATGTIAALNTGLNGTVFTPTLDFNGSTSVDVSTSDLGNTGSGGPLTDNDSVAITVNAVNDAPVITRPASVSTNEDTVFTFNGGNTISVADVDAASGNVTVTLGVSSGTISLSGTTGLTVGGNGTANITATGSLADLNAALNGLTYTPSLDYNGSDTLTIGANDNGNTGSGGPMTDNQSTAITVNPVNDAPVATADSYNVNEDNTLAPLAASGVLANDTDVDTPHSSLTAVLDVGPTNAQSFTLNPDGSFSYTPNSNFNGSDSFTYHAFDGALSSNTVMVSIGIAAVNDAPVITRPANVSTNEDNSFTFSGTISLSDVDAGAGSLSLTLGVTNGTLTLSGTTGLTVGGDGTNSITASGTLADLNTALNGLVYAPNADYNGSDTLTIGINDNGNTGLGGPLSDNQSTAITVNAVDDPPVNTVPGAQSINEDNSLTFTGATAISVADIDAGAGNLQVTLSTANGTITLGGTVGLTVTGNGTGSVQATGTIAALNTGLNGTVFAPTLDFNGSTSVDVSTSDLGNTGAGGPLTDNDSVAITVNAVNDAPVITRPAAVSTNEDNAFTFNGGNTISVADIDAGAGSVTVTLSVSNGTLALSGTTGLSVTGDGTASINASGTLADLNAALNGLVYTPTADFSGSDTLNIGVNDNGNTGIGGPLTDSKSTAITVNPVNDAPVAVADGYSVNEDGTLTVNAASGVLANDTDVDTPHASLTAVLDVGPSSAQSFTLNPDGSFNYTPNADFNGSDSFTYHAFDGALSSNIVSVNITINAVDDAPVITRPATATVNEDTNFTFSAGNVISVADIDAGAGSVTITLTANNGTMTLSGLTGLSFSVGDGTADATMTFSGTLTNVNNALNGSFYRGNQDYNGSDTLTITANDNGNTGTGGPLSDTKSVSITINPVNDPPVISGAGQTLNYTENDPASVVDNTVVVNDVDSPNLNFAGIQITGNYVNGQDVLQFTNTPPISGFFIAGTGQLVLNGVATVAQYQAAMRTVKYVNNSDNPSTLQRTITWQVHDTTGGVSNLNIHSFINVTAVNDAPVNTMPSSPTMNQDSTMTMSGANAIQISDVDAGTNAVQVTLTGGNGTMTLNGISGLSFSVGDGTADSTMTFTGTITNINTALNGMQFSSSAGFFGTATINIVTDDQGFTGTGGALNDNDTLNITVQQVNQPPVNTVPGAQSTNEDTALTFSSGNGNQISTSDPDAGAATVQISLGVLQGTLHLIPTGGVTINNNDTANVTATGSITNLNTALNGLVYTPTLNYNGPDTLTFTTNDLGNTGPGGAQQDTDTVSITVNAVNDAPVITRPATISVAEDATFTFNGGNVVSIADVDIAAGNVTVGLSVTNGTLTLSGITGLSFTLGDGTSDTAMTFSGTLTDVNNALNGMTYTGNLNFNGSDTLNISADDNGNTGSGGNGTDAKTTGITITAVDDAPVNSVPGTQTFDEDTTLTFSSGNGNAITTSDIDAAPGNVTVTLTTTAGTMAFGSVVGLSAVTNNAATITGTGTLAAVNNAMNGLIFTPTANLNGAQTISFTTNDNSNTGSGGPLSDTDIINLSITPVNDAPVLAGGGNTAAFTESGVLGQANTAVVVNGAITISDVDGPTTNIVGATIQITTNYQGGGKDVLAFTPAFGVTGIFSNATGTLTLTGTTTRQNYQTLLQGVTYNSTSEDPTTGTRTVVFQVDDGGSVNNISNTQSSSVTVTATNDPPTAISYCASGCTNLALPAQAGIQISFGAGKLGGSDVAEEAANGTVVTLNTTPDSNCAGCTLAIAANGSFTFTPPPSAAGTTVQFTYHVADNGKPGAGVNSASATVAFTVAGPAIYFVKSAAVGAADCKLGSECLFATAVTNIGANTNSIIFMEDANSHVPGAVALNPGGSVIGQGVVGVSFDNFFGINASPGSGGTLAARPSINQTRPTLTTSPLTLNTGSSARGFNINNNAGDALIAATKTGLVVSDMNVVSNANVASTYAVHFTSSSGTFTFGDVSINPSRNGNAVNFTSTTSASTVTFNNVTIGAAGTGVAVTIASSGTTNFTFNDVTSNTGRAVDINTGSGAFTFHAINANTSATGVLVQSATGSFTVNGTTTTAGTGGTIQNCTANGMKFTGSNNITLKNMNLTGNGTAQTVTGAASTCGGNLTTGDNLSCVANLFIQTATGVTLNNDSIINSKQMGLNGNAITDLTVTGCTISSNGDEDKENGITIQNLKGTSSIGGATLVQNNTARQAYIENTTAGTLNLTVTGSTFGRTVAPGVLSQQGLLMQIGNSQLNVDVGTSTFASNGNGNGFQCNILAGGSMGSVGTHSAIHNCSFTNNAAGVFTQTISGGSVYFDTMNNATITVNGLQGIIYAVNAGSPAAGLFNGIIMGNTVGTNGVSQSACNGAGGCDGIDVVKDGAATMQVRVDTNILQNFNTNGIKVKADVSGSGQVKVINNTIRQPSGGANQGNALLVQTAPSAGSSPTLCLDFTTNTITGTYDPNGSAAAVYLQVKNNGIIQLPGLSPVSGATNAQVQTFVSGNNGGTTVFAERFNAGTYNGGAACTVP